eukprot:TRINITY_DN14420_c0_g1_i1.p1 TRINITY_DN14420_c0_g1~~TRINITY_DN14420_c0_g1_i1.p1  ORF type:complete len:1029 (+),score=201.37 TRINITY_DN14420_c0_g1_i1:160-3246(+)
MCAFVQFPQQDTVVRVQHDGTYGGLLRAVQAHKRAAHRTVSTLWFNFSMAEGQQVRVEVDSSSFGDLRPDRDVVYVEYEPAAEAASPLPNGGPPPAAAALNDSSVTAVPSGAKSRGNPGTPLPVATPGSSSGRRPPVPRLRLTPDLLQPPEPSPLSRHGARQLSVPEALRQLAKSDGRIEVVRVPQFLRSISVDFQPDDLWARLASCKLSQDGYISHRDLHKVVEHFANAAAATPARPLDFSQSPQQQSPLVLSSRGDRPTPRVATPRTCVTVRDVLPLGASAVSPMPGHQLDAILAELQLNDPSSRSTSRSSQRGRNSSPRPHTSRRAHSAGYSVASLRTVADATEAWPEFRCGGPNGARPAAAPPPRGACSAADEDRACQQVARVLEGRGGTVSAAELPLVFSISQTPCSPGTLPALLEELRLQPQDPLGRRELGLVLSRLHRLPPEQAVARVLEVLRLFLQESGCSSSSDADGPPPRRASGMAAAPAAAAAAAVAGACLRPHEALPQPAPPPLLPPHGGGTSRPRPAAAQGSRLSGSSSRHSDSSALPLRCARCGAGLGRRLQTVCGSCRLASYCSEACQASDWADHQPICDIITQHLLSQAKPVRVLARHCGVPFHVQGSLSEVQTHESPGAGGNGVKEQGSQYLLVVSQRAPVVQKVFVVLCSVTGHCEFSYPPLHDGVQEADVHGLLYDVFAAAFEAGLQQGIWTLCGCCLGPMRGYLCKDNDFKALIEYYRRYYNTFLREHCQTMVFCRSAVQFELIVQPLETLCEAYESRALQLSREQAPSREADRQFVEALAQSRDFYLQLLAFLSETDFADGLRERARKERLAAMRKVAVVYQHLAARERGNRAMNYLQQSEDTLRELVREDPSAESYRLLALMYDCLPDDRNYQRKADAARRRAQELAAAAGSFGGVLTPPQGRGGLAGSPRAADGAGCGGPGGATGAQAGAPNGRAAQRPPSPPVRSSGAAAAEETRPRCAVCQARTGTGARKEWDRASRRMLYFCCEQHLTAHRRQACGDRQEEQ